MQGNRGNFGPCFKAGQNHPDPGRHHQDQSNQDNQPQPTLLEEAAVGLALSDSHNLALD